MGGHGRLPIHAILNQPTCPRPGTPKSEPSASEFSSPTSEASDNFSLTMTRPSNLKNKKVRDSSDLSYTKPQAPIKYPPFENLSETAHRAMAPFSVDPIGDIGRYCAHIPYSSDKKDVKEKTGRESFHVFVYTFTDPTDQQKYDVMWDYLGGYVRISPFFKSRKHKKTGPAKMLDANPGLREITFHMTGGNRVAQGYWVPYDCARAVCATFCFPIAGALIPIFGPDFPQDCTRPDSPRYGRMDIEPEIIQRSTRNATANRFAHTWNGQDYNGRLAARPTSHPRAYAGLFHHAPVHHDPLRGLMTERIAQHHHIDTTSATPQAWCETPHGLPSHNGYPEHPNWIPPAPPPPFQVRGMGTISPEHSPEWRPNDAHTARDDPLYNIDPILRGHISCPASGQNALDLDAIPKSYTTPGPHVQQSYEAWPAQVCKRRRIENDEHESERRAHHSYYTGKAGTPLPPPTSLWSELVTHPTIATERTRPEGVPAPKTHLKQSSLCFHVQAEQGYTDEERKAAFSLVNLRDKPKGGTTAANPAKLKRPRAKSV